MKRRERKKIIREVLEYLAHRRDDRGPDGWVDVTEFLHDNETGKEREDRAMIMRELVEAELLEIKEHEGIQLPEGAEEPMDFCFCHLFRINNKGMATLHPRDPIYRDFVRADSSLSFLQRFFKGPVGKIIITVIGGVIVLLLGIYLKDN